MSDSIGARSAGFRRRKKLGKKAETFSPIESFLPDDVVIDILSKLPAKDVLRCRCVCKLWRDLTSTRDFIDLHIRRGIPMILNEDSDGRRVLLDRCWEPAQTRLKIHKLYGPDHKGEVFSQNGLIVVADERCSDLESVFVIYNRIYRDVVKIKVPNRKYYKGRVCGVFFHPVLKEYCILWEKSLYPCKVQYRILNLESNPVWRDIYTQNAGIWYMKPVPVLIDKYLYWIVHPSQCFDDYAFNCKIMEYDIIKVEFRVIPSPVRVNYENVNLVNIDGVVSVVQVLPSKESVRINIWTLYDDGEQLWMSSNYIVSSDLYLRHSVPKAIAFRNGELVLFSRRRLYACNLKLGTFRKFGQIYKYYSKFLPHLTSLVSLKNCKSNICMADEDENNQP